VTPPRSFSPRPLDENGFFENVFYPRTNFCKLFLPTTPLPVKTLCFSGLFQFFGGSHFPPYSLPLNIFAIGVDPPNPPSHRG